MRSASGQEASCPRSWPAVDRHARALQVGPCGQYRADPRSPDWIGGAVADVLKLDVEADGDRKRIKTILKEWYKTGVLKTVERRDDATRKPFLFVEPGNWSED